MLSKLPLQVQPPQEERSDRGSRERREAVRRAESLKLRERVPAHDFTVEFSPELLKEISGSAWAAVIVYDRAIRWRHQEPRLRDFLVPLDDVERPRTLMVRLEVNWVARVIRLELVWPHLVL